MKLQFKISKIKDTPTVMEVIGEKGSGCLKKTRALRNKLAATNGGLQRKPEFRDVDTCQNISF